MKLYRGKIPDISREIIQCLSKEGDIAVEADLEQEAILDMEAVLKEYLNFERRVTEEAKNRLEAQQLPYSKLGRMRSQAAKDLGAPASDEILPYLLEQILQFLLHTQNVDEVFAEDATLRRKLAPILRKHMEMETELDREVRSKIRNLEEGTANFEVEYTRIMDEVKRKKRLD